MDLGLTGKRALVTGGTHGIGLAVAFALEAEGCDVTICSRDVLKSVPIIQSSAVGRMRWIHCDALDPLSIRNMLKKHGGHTDILINNVGGGGRWGSAVFEETKEEVWDEVYQKNTGIATQCTMAVIPAMKKQGWGRVVTIASIFGKEGGGRPWFTMAKSAQIALMKTLAMHPDYARAGITFNTVAPGSIMIPDTDWEAEKKKNPRAFAKLMRESYPMGRLGTPEEVAAVITFLCSPHASLVNGACITVDGGESSSF